ncbi:MAG: hypothetical protein C3F02_00885 [Parcubacteria group bacterium]|nr:MAG: hypothetical protein C3F02_00885 [Parcubacteria group bacterium]
MKIVIDLRIYGPRVGGLGRYNQKLLEELVKIDLTNQYILIFKEAPDDLPQLPANFQIKIANCRWYTVKEQIVMPFILYSLQADLVHFPHFNVPIFYRGKFLVTIHDLIMTKFPSRRASTHRNNFVFNFKYWFYNRIIKSAVHRAWRIIAVSEFGRQDLIKHFKMSSAQSDKIKVVYEGITKLGSPFVEKISLPENFFLYVGNAYPHKNLEFLIDVFIKFKIKHPDFYLILIGQKNYFYERLKILTRQSHPLDKNNIIFVGYVPDNLLGAYYQQARAYVFPSLYEGFGLPPLEAMSLGTPILSSQSSCLSEILGPAALYFDPLREESLLEKMEMIICQENIAFDLKQAGFKQIEKYSWVKMAGSILEIYRTG